MVIALSAGDHTYVGVSAYCFLKPAVLLKAKQAQIKSFCEIFCEIRESGEQSRR